MSILTETHGEDKNNAENWRTCLGTEIGHERAQENISHGVDFKWKAKNFIIS